MPRDPKTCPWNRRQAPQPWPAEGRVHPSCPGLASPLCLHTQSSGHTWLILCRRPCSWGHPPAFAVLPSNSLGLWREGPSRPVLPWKCFTPPQVRSAEGGLWHLAPLGGGIRFQKGCHRWIRILCWAFPSTTSPPQTHTHIDTHCHTLTL